MPLFNQHWIGMDGEPITGRVPTQMFVVNGQKLTGPQEGAVFHAYKLFCDAVQFSANPSGYHVQHRCLADGTTVRMESNLGVHKVLVLPPGSSDKDFCEFYLEHGLVDVKEWRPNQPAVNDPGVLYSTPHVRQYIFSGMPEGVSYGTPKALGVGKVRVPPTLAGVQPGDGDQSTSFTSEKVYGLADKKMASLKCPSSAFTGRTRLYVQALYGSADKNIVIRSNGITAPSLYINTKEREEAEPIKYGLSIGSGTGLYFHEETATHWLLVPDQNSVSIYKFFYTPCAEKLRDVVKKNYRRLTKDRQEAVEALLLSNLVPDPTPHQTLAIPETNTSCFGYSWHFNWSGNACDIVDTGVYSNDTDGKYYGSTHYRLNFTVSYSKDSGFAFSVSRAQIGYGVWRVPRNINVIAYPDWGSGRLTKFGIKPTSEYMASSGKVTIYVFYSRDTLKTVDVEVIKDAPETFRESSPIYFGGTEITGSPLRWLAEKENGITIQSAYTNKYSIGFFCGDSEVSGISANESAQITQNIWAGRVRELTRGPEWEAYQSIPCGPVTLTFTLDSNGRVHNLDATWSQSAPFGGPNSSETIERGQWTSFTKYSEITHGVFSILIIPFMDAEAVYLSGETLKRSSSTVHRSIEKVDLGWYYYSYFSSDAGVFTRDWFLDPYSKVVEYLGSQEVAEEETKEVPCRVFSSQGTFPVEQKASDLAAFYSNADDIPLPYVTKSSINGCIHNEWVKLKEGFPDVPASALEQYAFVGIA